ncbi:hypothetical protein [Maribacter sp. HTCC2170]|uniref:hypothetical protein n=1 Tax=Maribacter sp. (strain HTCC2170 / KCCM 42371) TaxID=313603 RepID=UPI00006B3B09|nr:hypothetical protein [Maribacter sp. HTCC2170]EAQ99741.1 hypothetical protein FB2170_07294 [Maribacter sp. HTCC2170]
MRHTLLLLVVSLFVISCGDTKKKTTTETQTSTTESPIIGRSNYAVVWNWTTTDVKLVTENAQKISEELTALWKEDIVENVYYNSDSKVDKLAHFPNISFFIKAEDTKDAESILNNLTVVKKGIAKFSLHPVGIKWLGRNIEAIKERGMTKSYVVVWNTITKHDQSNAKELIKENVKAQSDAILDLWEEGVVENIYMDIEGTIELNLVSDFVCFVNVNSEKEAEELLGKLPFVTKNIASYKIFPVGTFWLGDSKEN